MTYIGKINKIKKILNKNGRSENGVNTQENFLNLLKDLKTDYGIEVSKEFLFNLMDKKKEKKKKRQKINNLLRGVETYEIVKYSRPTEFVKCNVEIKEYGFDKQGDVCIKNSRMEQVQKEFVKPTKKILQVIKV